MLDKINELSNLSEYLVLNNLVNFVLATLLPSVVMLVVGVLVIRGIKSIMRRLLAKSKLEKAAHSLILSLTTAVLYLLLGLMVASSLGIDVTGIVALASVLTLAVSLSIQNFLTNVIGGFVLLYNQPFHSGDYVEVGAEAGTVMEIGMSYTKLQTPDNKMISIPNATVVAGDIVNYSVTGTRRLDINIRAEYEEDSQRVIDALLEAGEDPRVLADPAPCAVITGYGTDAVNYSLRVWTKTDDYWDVNFLINRRIRDSFAEKDIRIAYPRMHVQLDK